MRTLKQIEFIRIQYQEELPAQGDLEERVLYISREFEVSKHNCLCGCGNMTVLPFNNIIEGVDHGWTLTELPDGRVTITPSVGNFYLPCKSHYIITKNIANFV